MDYDWKNYLCDDCSALVAEDEEAKLCPECNRVATRIWEKEQEKISRGIEEAWRKESGNFERVKIRIPAPNAIAGILIGIANDTWFARLIIPFAWGIVFCLYTWIARQEEKDDFVAKRQAIQGQKTRWGMPHVQAFYFVEYITAVSTSLVFSVVAGLIKEFF